MKVDHKCILCADMAQERKYFFKGKPLCSMHYAEYLEVLIESSDSVFTGDDAFNAFYDYRQTLEPTPLDEIHRREKKEKKKKNDSHEIELYTIR